MCFFTIRTRIINERMLLLRIGNNLLKRNCMTNVRIYLYNPNFCATKYVFWVTIVVG